MAVTAVIREVFGRFQNLNLLALVHDLRDGNIARHAWLWGSRLCPVAHGMPAGSNVRDLKALGQASSVEDGCTYAARWLGADSETILRFVLSWDEEILSRERLLQQIEELWIERRADAEAVQRVLQGPSIAADSWPAR